MCIRDRLTSVLYQGKEIKNQIEKQSWTLKNVQESGTIAVISVSYTHLDVYKRQLLYLPFHQDKMRRLKREITTGTHAMDYWRPCVPPLRLFSGEKNRGSIGKTNIFPVLFEGWALLKK